MNKKVIKQIAALIMAAGFSGITLAHDYVGVVGNSTRAARTDRFYLVCAPGSQKLTFQVRDIATRPEKSTKLYIRADKPGASPAITALSWDARDADAGYSPLLTITGGSGAYFFNVGKTAGAPGVVGAEAYVARIHCYNTDGEHNPDDQPYTVRYISNQ